ncbi:hypothetical protein CASFOL_021610 [Castilleja foliolosa]|uniref:Uncharacterized protein n=1 Tax=Castilleja foliolosa TaxID=1961234 RepID=A0ABD3D0I9_9LAMI
MRSSGVWFGLVLEVVGVGSERPRVAADTPATRAKEDGHGISLKEDWLPDWEIMSKHWCEGTTSLCCPHLDERNGSTFCLLMELPYSSKVGKQLHPDLNSTEGYFRLKRLVLSARLQGAQGK